MTYEEAYTSFTRRERIACTIMCHMRTNEEGFWTTCFRNKIISKVASMILGRNVFDWEIELADKISDWQDKDELEELRTELTFLKELLA